MSEDKKQVSHLVSESLYEDAKEAAEHGELSEAVRQAYRIVAYGDDHEETARLEHKLERAKNEYASLVEQREELEEQMEETEQRIRRLEDRLEEVSAGEERYEEHLEELETELRDGSHVFPDHGLVQEAAEAGNTSPQQVIEDLKERNPEVPDHAFEPAHRAEFRWTGVDRP